MKNFFRVNPTAGILILLLGTLFTSACSAGPAEDPGTAEVAHQGEAAGQEGEARLTLPTVEPVPLDGRPLRVVATTSIVGDVISQVGGDAIELKTLMGPGQDPHSYQPAAADLTAVAQADVVFINGWNLEEGLLDDLANIGQGVPLVPVSAGIRPLAFGEQDHEKEADETGEDHDHGGADPHVWQSVDNVKRWTENIAATLSALDPANAALYSANAQAYQAELSDLDAYAREQLATIPVERRVLVTNHNAFAYLAAAYGFDVLGTIIPGASTLSEPTASDLAALAATMRAEGVCAVFTETTVSDRLAQTVAAELKDCDNVQVVKLYTGALGEAGSGADSYRGMMRANVDAIVAALR